MTKRENDLEAEAISLLMKMANLIDDNILENPETINATISSQQIGCGYRVWSCKLRNMIALINGLKSDNYRLYEKINYLESELNDRPNMEELSDKHQEEIWEHYKMLLNEERAEN